MQSPADAMLNKVDSEGGILVRPVPGFVVKTRLLQGSQAGTKVFFNVCSDPHVEKPHEKTLEGMGEDQFGVRVPLSVGSPIEDFDKKKDPCLTLDLVANPDTIAEANGSTEFREMVIRLCMAAVEQKYNWRLDPKYKLPKITYKGPQQVQRLKVTKQSEIQELSPSTQQVEEVSSSSRVADSPAFNVWYAPRGTDPSHVASDAPWQSAFELPCYEEDFGRNLQEKGWITKAKNNSSDEKDDLEGTDWLVQVSLPTISNVSKEVQVAISDEVLEVSFPKAHYVPLTIWWPRYLDSSKAKTWFLKPDLFVTLPASSSPADGFDVFENA